MSLKDLCIDWVEERLFENDDGTFEIMMDPMDKNCEPEGPYTEEKALDILWQRAPGRVWEGLINAAEAKRDAIASE